MGIWVAVFITLAVMGSILWVMPSPRDKMLIEMRQKAMRLGLKVRILDKSLADKLYPWLEDYRGYVLYEKYFPAGKKPLSSKARVIRLTEALNVHELDEKDPLRQRMIEEKLIAHLPESSEAITLFSGGIAVLWKERDQPLAIENIDECLDRCIAWTNKC